MNALVLFPFVVLCCFFFHTDQTGLDPACGTAAAHLVRGACSCEKKKKKRGRSHFGSSLLPLLRPWPVKGSPGAARNGSGGFSTPGAGGLRLGGGLGRLGQPFASQEHSALR